MHLTRLALALILALGMVAPARAGKYHSPLLNAPAGGHMTCYVSNVGTRPVTVTVTLYQFDGDVIVPSGDLCAGFGGVLPAGESCYSQTSQTAARCTVDASSSQVRAELLAFDGSNNVIAAMAATKK